ncbi:peptidase C78 family protein [Nitzschia inconspicua]|uniref:Peptidase C78 family protein n=1 Tax=Nitzschia inconspicua TaxID=303405 RepID=A0A9K3PTI2_9STRA|nr:peptidase C78 family protein [Nitzschia inconspicua]
MSTSNLASSHPEESAKIKSEYKTEESSDSVPPSKRQKTGRNNGVRKCSDTKEGRKDNGSATKEISVILEPGDDATMTYRIMDRFRLYVHKTQFLSCLEGPSSSLASTAHHIQQKDQWSCGIRNLQMLLSAILPHLPASHTLFQHIPLRQIAAVPTRLHLLKALERAWNDGFDAKGAQHYDYTIAGKSGRSAHIGAIEVANIFWYFGLDATVVQFIKCPESRKLLPKFVKAFFSKATALEGCSFCCDNDKDGPPRASSKYCANSLLEYAEADMPFAMPQECSCPIIPLYLQWEGHSVSIVGVDSTEENLLVLDPLKPASQLVRNMDAAQSLQPLCLPTRKLANKDTQIVLATLLPLDQAERKQYKQSGNVVTAAEAAVQLFCRAH